MRKIDGDEAEALLLKEYERHVRMCDEDMKTGAFTLASCAWDRAQGLRIALQLVKGIDTVEE